MWAFKDKAFYLLRPKRRRRSVRASNVKSKQLQPVMSSADGIRADSVGTSANDGQTIVARQSVIATLFARLPMATEYWRKLITVTGRPPPRGYEPPRRYEPQAKEGKEAELKTRAPGRAGALAISICFGLLVCSGIVIATLFTQVRDMQADIALLKLRLAGVDSHLNRLEVGRLEEIAQQKIKEAKIAETPPPPRRVQISLSNDDIKLLRASIKVLPSQPGAQSKVQLGQEISNISTVPVPGSVVGQIPKLRGARFLVDDNGAIIIIAEGSTRADVVIEPQ
jgi:hypothetical protein